MKIKMLPLRASVSRKIIMYLHRHPLEFVSKIELQILYSATAKASRQPGRLLLHLTAADALAEYARFTTKCIQSYPNSRALHRSFYRTAFRLGRRIRLFTGFTNAEDLCKLVFFLYENIGIDMQGTLPGEIQVNKCYFSQLYSPSECRIMSGMDSGIIAGIFSETPARLHFSQRITEHCPTCSACFLPKDSTTL